SSDVCSSDLEGAPRAGSPTISTTISRSRGRRGAVVQSLARGALVLLERCQGGERPGRAFVKQPGLLPYLLGIGPDRVGIDCQRERLRDGLAEVEAVIVELDLVELVRLELDLFLGYGRGRDEAQRDRLVDLDRQVFARDRAALHNRRAQPPGGRDRLAIGRQRHFGSEPVDRDQAETGGQRGALLGARGQPERRGGQVPRVDRARELGRSHSEISPARSGRLSSAATWSSNACSRAASASGPRPSCIVTLR